MKNQIPSRLLRGTLVLVAAAATSLALAQVPPLQQQGVGKVACGGIGLDQSQPMRAAMSKYPLSILMSRPSGEYLANVNVTITHAKGGSEAMQFEADGPICLIELPKGRYVVTATSPNGTVRKNTVSVGSGHRGLDLRFPGQ